MSLLKYYLIIIYLISESFSIDDYSFILKLFYIIFLAFIAIAFTLCSTIFLIIESLKISSISYIDPHRLINSLLHLSIIMACLLGKLSFIQYQYSNYLNGLAFLQPRPKYI